MLIPKQSILGNQFLLLQASVPLNKIHIGCYIKLNKFQIHILLNLRLRLDFNNFGQFLNDLKIFLLIIIGTADNKTVSASL